MNFLSILFGEDKGRFFLLQPKALPVGVEYFLVMIAGNFSGFGEAEKELLGPGVPFNVSFVINVINHGSTRWGSISAAIDLKAFLAFFSRSKHCNISASWNFKE